PREQAHRWHLIAVDPKDPFTLAFREQPTILALYRRGKLKKGERVRNRLQRASVLGGDPVVDGHHDLSADRLEKRERGRKPRTGVVSQRANSEGRPLHRGGFYLTGVGTPRVECRG